eukprot:3882471-Pleurochrysis_carterae.AAC.1
MHGHAYALLLTNAHNALARYSHEGSRMHKLICGSPPSPAIDSASSASTAFKPSGPCPSEPLAVHVPQRGEAAFFRSKNKGPFVCSALVSQLGDFEKAAERANRVMLSQPAPEHRSTAEGILAR